MDSALETLGCQTEKPFRVPGMVSSSQLGKLAAEIFEDEEFVNLCQEGINAQLQRTKEGATTQSRILELAGLVKLLRRGMKECMVRVGMFVEQSVKTEKDIHTQAESSRLSSEATVKELEAEVALARKNAAQIEATYKTEKAGWVSELELHKFEVSRLKQEQERLLEDRDKIREEARRTEVARVQLETELKELRKQSSQRIREVQVHQDETLRSWSEGKQALEKQEQALRDENLRLTSRVESLSDQLCSVSRELEAMQQLHRQVQQHLEGKSSQEAVLARELGQLHEQVHQWRSKHDEVSGLASQRLKDINDLQEQLVLVQNDVKLKGSRMEVLQQQVRDCQEAHTADVHEWDKDRQTIRELQEEKAALRSSLVATTSRYQDLLGDQQSLTARHNQLTDDHARLNRDHHQLSANLEAATAAAARLHGELEKKTEELKEAYDIISKKSARLTHMEGEFEALQEVIGEGEQRDTVSRLVNKIANLQRVAAEAETVRRQLHNQLVELKGNIRVFCRVKPHPCPVVTCSPGNTSLQLTVDDKEHTFTFDRIFAPEASQQDVFHMVSDLVQSALDGYHVCLFSYGQTGAGKTHTMQGLPDPHSQGIIPRSIKKILETVQKLEDQDWQYRLEASFIEVYNNSLRDLLADKDGGRISDQNCIKHDSQGGHTLVMGAMRVPVTSTEVANQLIQKAAAARACEATAMNATSSRSHVVFMLYISGVHEVSNVRLQGCLSLVDLAGSERLNRSLAEDVRKKETCAINQSLSSLGDVFSALAAKSAHVPYRNSRLTYLLQPCLGGHGKTLMFVNINPEPSSAYESLCSLKFAAKVNSCETAAKGGAKRNITHCDGKEDAASVVDARRMTLGGDEHRRMTLGGGSRGLGSSITVGKRLASSTAWEKSSKRTKMG